MADMNFAYREDWSCSGFFGWSSTGVKMCDNGFHGLKHYITFDQGAWIKQDEAGAGGTLTQTFDTGTYRVTDSLTTSGAAYVAMYRRFRLPRDFGSWSNITLMSSRNASADFIFLQATLYKGVSADAGLNGVTIAPSTTDTWQQFTLTPTGLTYNPGDFLTLKIILGGGDVGVQSFVADIAPAYYTARGNV